MQRGDKALHFSGALDIKDPKFKLLEIIGTCDPLVPLFQNDDINTQAYF